MFCSVLLVEVRKLMILSLAMNNFSKEGYQWQTCPRGPFYEFIPSMGAWASDQRGYMQAGHRPLVRQGKPFYIHLLSM